MKEASAIQIFLAHASEDKPQVRQLYQKLQGAGYQPWMDEEDLIGGQNWREEITKAKFNLVSRLCLLIGYYKLLSGMFEGDLSNNQWTDRRVS